VLGFAAIGVLVGAGPRCGNTVDPLVGANGGSFCSLVLGSVLLAPVSLLSMPPNNPVMPSTKPTFPSFVNLAISRPAPLLTSLRQYSQSLIHDTKSTRVTPPSLSEAFESVSSPSLIAELIYLETSQ